MNGQLLEQYRIIPDLEIRHGETGIPANRELPQSVNKR